MGCSYASLKASPNAYTNAQRAAHVYELFNCASLVMIYWRFINEEALPLICHSRHRKIKQFFRKRQITASTLELRANRRVRSFGSFFLSFQSAGATSRCVGTLVSRSYILTRRYIGYLWFRFSGLSFLMNG